MPPHFRVLIADDHRLFAESLMTVLSNDDRVDVVGIAPDGANAVELTRDLEPDLVLMDLNMPVMDGLEATRQIRDMRLHSGVIIMTGETEPSANLAAGAAGAHGFVSKDQSIDAFMSVFLEVASLVSLLAHAPAR